MHSLICFRTAHVQAHVYLRALLYTRLPIHRAVHVCCTNQTASAAVCRGLRVALISGQRVIIVRPKAGWEGGVVAPRLRYVPLLRLFAESQDILLSQPQSTSVYLCPRYGCSYWYQLDRDFLDRTPHIGRGERLSIFESSLPEMFSMR